MRAVPHTTNARWDCNGVTVGLPPSCPTSLHAPAIITAGISCIRRFFWKLETATPQVTVAFIAPKAKKAGLLFCWRRDKGRLLLRQHRRGLIRPQRRGRPAAMCYASRSTPGTHGDATSGR